MAELVKKDSQNFHFYFIKQKIFTIYLTNKENSDFGKYNNQNKEPRYIDLNTIKYNIVLVIKDVENNINYGKIQLNRDSTIISHFTSENLKKLDDAYNITSDNNNFNFSKTPKPQNPKTPFLCQERLLLIN